MGLPTMNFLPIYNLQCTVLVSLLTLHADRCNATQSILLPQPSVDTYHVMLSEQLRVTGMRQDPSFTTL